MPNAARVCQSCGRREDQHNVRHPFVALTLKEPQRLTVGYVVWDILDKEHITRPYSRRYDALVAAWSNVRDYRDRRTGVASKVAPKGLDILPVYVDFPA